MQYRMSFLPCRSVGICSGGTVSIDSTSNGGWVKSGSSDDDSRILLVASRSLVCVRVFSVESFDSFFQEDPSYFEGVPLGDKKFVFDVSLDATRNVAKS